MEDELKVKMSKWVQIREGKGKEMRKERQQKEVMTQGNKGRSHEKERLGEGK